MTTPLSTTLGGTLQRYPGGWRWSDGTPEPRVRDMTYTDIAPNFRCSGSRVEIPWNWREARYWPKGRIDTDAALRIDGLLKEAGKRAPIYAEGIAEAIDDHRVTKHGWTVPIALWDAEMLECCGCWWDKSAEDEILARARSLGWQG